MPKDVSTLIKQDLQNHKVEVILPGETEPRTLFLVIEVAKTSRLDDIKLAYQDEITDLHVKLAEKIFGQSKTDNYYGCLVDENMTIVFSFNMDFAIYDKRSEMITYKSLEQILLSQVNPAPAPPKPPQFPSGRPSRPGGKIVMRYSLTEK